MGVLNEKRCIIFEKLKKKKIIQNNTDNDTKINKIKQFTSAFEM